MKIIRTLAVATFAMLALAACGGGGSETSEPTSATTTPASTATSVPSESQAPSGGSDLTLTAPVGASNSGFAEKELTADADTPLTITFVNEDTGVPHNVQIFEGTDTTVTPLWAPEGNELITGVGEETYEVPALAAGTYTYNCFSHPATMLGTLTVA